VKIWDDQILKFANFIGYLRCHVFAWSHQGLFTFECCGL